MKINKDFINTLRFSLCILVLFGYFIGNKLDEYFQTNGFLLAIFIILSIVTGFIGFFITIFKKIK